MLSRAANLVRKGGRRVTSLPLLLEDHTNLTQEPDRGFIKQQAPTHGLFS